MADISKITLPSGTTYDLKDAYARDLIKELHNFTEYLGCTTTNLISDVTTDPNVEIAGETVTAKQGDIVTKLPGHEEFIYNGTVWQQFGDLSGLGLLAYKNSASGSFVPNGSITSQSFTGASTTSTGKFTPSGSISGTTFTGASMTSTGNFTPSGTNDVTAAAPKSGETKNYTPSGTVTGTFTGSSMTSTGKFTASGTVSKPTVTPSTSSVNSVDTSRIATAITGFAVENNVDTKPVYISGVTGETLAFSFSVPTTQAAVATESKSVLTGVDVAAPTFTGTADQAVSVTGTTTGSVTGLGFTGDDVLIKSTFTGTQGNVSVTGTTTGSVTDGTFTGTEDDVSVTGTPNGNISVTWQGSSTNVTVE